MNLLTYFLITLLMALWGAFTLADENPDQRPAQEIQCKNLERVELTSDESKLALVADFCPPATSLKGAPIPVGAVLIHDLGGSRASFRTLAKRLQAAGIPSITVDLRAHGESASPTQKRWEGMSDEEKSNLLVFAFRDLTAGARFLKKDKNIHSQSYHLVAYGKSAALALRQFERTDNEIRKVVLINPTTEDEVFGLPCFASLDRLSKDSSENTFTIVAPRSTLDFARDKKLSAVKMHALGDGTPALLEDHDKLKSIPALLK